MTLNIPHHIHSFFERNLFERLIVYLFMAPLVSTLVFEAIIGQHYFKQSQNEQWIFFGLLGLDYLISLKKVINIRVTVNPISIFAFILFIMVAHGTFVGIMNNNAPFVILNDIVPPLMIGLNILRMQSFTEIKKPIDFQFIFRSVVILGAVICGIGIIAGKTSVGNNVIYYPLILTALILIRPFPKWAFIIILGSIALTLDDINRTTLLFIALIACSYIGWTALHNPVKAILTGLLAVITATVIWTTLPRDSQTYNRLSRLTEISLQDRTGSLGERQAEQDAVKSMLKQGGTTMQWFGAGFGGLYEVQFTHEYIKNYGHAHYAWVWFNLRFGYSGYVYMFIFISALIFSAGRGLSTKSELGFFTALLCLLGLIYTFTYVNSIFLLSGLHFLYVHNRNKT